MENEVVREDSESTQRKTWSAAEAAAFPALGIRQPGKAIEALSRVPRASVAPPSSETVITPAPKFNQAGVRIDTASPSGGHKSLDEIENLDGIVELSSAMLVDEGETGLHKVEMLADDLVHEVVEDEFEINDDHLIEEVDSDLLAYVETRGEISEKHHAVPAPTDVSKVSLASLHESLHNEAVASGMLTYSTGVPIHDLESGSSASRTLQIHRSTATNHKKLLKNLLIGGVFLAGIGAGIYFGLPSQSAPAVGSESAVATPALSTGASTAATRTASATGTAVPTAAPAIHVQPLHDSEEAAVAAPAAAPDIVVRPLDMGDSASAVAETVVEPQERTTARRERSKGSANLSPNTSGRAAPSDPGVLMLAAKPPCDILIDGKKTGLKTPQRVLRLPPGKHKVTLVNREHNLRDSFRVSIQSGKKTKVVRDMTSKIK